MEWLWGKFFCFLQFQLRFVIPLRMYNSWILPSLPLPNDDAMWCNCSSVCRLLTLKSSCFCLAPEFTFVHAVSHLFLHRISEKTQDSPNKNAGCLLKKMYIGKAFYFNHNVIPEYIWQTKIFQATVNDQDCDTLHLTQTVSCIVHAKNIMNGA